MTIASSFDATEREWHSAFSASDLTALRVGIPVGIHSAQARTADGYERYGDPDGERDVYGVGMSKAAPKDIRVELQKLDSYRDVRIPRTSRRLMFVGNCLIFPIRVGETMRRKKNELWLRSFSPTRQDYFTTHSSKRVDPTAPTLFEEEEEGETADDSHVLDALRHIEDDKGRSELFVPFYSSSPRGVGHMMWAPARLDGRYLHFIEPETLTHVRMPKRADQPAAKPQPAAGFADQPRPRTAVARRKKPYHPTGQGQ